MHLRYHLAAIVLVSLAPIHSVKFARATYMHFNVKSTCLIIANTKVYARLTDVAVHDLEAMRVGARGRAAYVGFM